MNRALAVLFVIYSYLGWFACVFLGKAQDSPWSLLVPLPALLFAVLKLKLKHSEWARALGLMFVGLGFDALSNHLGWIHFQPPVPSPLVPLWLVSLWLLFFNYLPTLAKLFQARSPRKAQLLLGIGIVLGALFGPLSYWSGQKIEVLLFDSPRAVCIYSVFWGLYFALAILLFRPRPEKPSLRRIA